MIKFQPSIRSISRGLGLGLLVVKNPPANTEDIGDMGSIPGLGRFTGRGHGNLLQYSCLKNLMDRETWQATVHGLQRVRHD